MTLHSNTVPSAAAGGKARGVDWAAAVREAGLAAFVALLLTVPLVGLRTVDRPTGLGIEARPEEVVASIVLVFLGRLGLGLIRHGLALPVLILALVCAGVGLLLPMPTQVLRLVLVLGGGVIAIRAALTVATGRSKLSQADRDKRMDRIAAKVQHASRYIGPVAVAFAAVLPLTPMADRMILDIGILLLTYIMLGWGLNIVVGLAGLLDLGYVAFYAVGAYSYALLAHYFGLSFWVCLPLAGLLAAISGVLLGFPVLRLRGDYFAIVTLGFGEIIRIILVNWYQFTGGPNGISGIPRPSFFGIADFSRSPADGMAAFHEMFGLEFSPLHRIIFLYYLILALALVVNLFTLRVRKLPLGRAWEALREDDIACASLGINRTNMKLAAFAIAAMFGGFAGSFFATRQGFISPESFTFIESAIILAIVVLGGMGSQIGVVVATLLVIGLPEAFRELADYRMLAFGGGMVLIMLWRPRGLLAHRDPTILLHGGSHGGNKPPAATGAAK
ncbi:high-affinity branched-chain amino acid ABC transporter permease LivM [Azospirillum ramasamyi]|uniref:Branched-chain amino acid ABC transporter permease n=1 Tax=Azospirillum ramasamyi TaxID=682998 RepID=A0A2U9SDJ9_9PROT|nr:high-affinity branched-chain amino acid ABC transporter permease LivM [Azospirillum ramasamyi]AWU97364.1 branched-chain amino acid ABC transporter permease [Azospirillum ramasamyi]AWU97665.1 branched-chain amino acid ABC transporter permease [Azospirillum ramasamyi]